MIFFSRYTPKLRLFGFFIFGSFRYYWTRCYNGKHYIYIYSKEYLFFMRGGWKDSGNVVLNEYNMKPTRSFELLSLRKRFCMAYWCMGLRLSLTDDRGFYVTRISRKTAKTAISNTLTRIIYIYANSFKSRFI